MRVLCLDPEATFALGERVGRAAFPGMVLLLEGDLGAGKTVFARGVGAGLDVLDRVQSPTFVIVQAHSARLPFWHADLYRLAGADDLEQLGLEDLLGSDGVVAIEWPDRLAAPPADALRVVLAEVDGAREVSLSATGPRHQAALDAL